MFKKEPESSPDPLPAQPDARLFLAAQAERIHNKLDIDGNPMVSTLGEAPEKISTSVDHFIHSTDRDPRYAEPGLFRTVLDTVRKGFFDARYDNEFYDPLDGDPTVGYYLGLPALNRSQKEHLYAVVDEYYQYLTEVTDPKTEKKVGRHVLLAAKEHGRRAVRTEPLPLPIESELQKG
ncbi:MAG TPA: hypothetical protein VIM31_04705 [Candidatus Microsaccharimonas sp.]|jgi:hypothetical protein